MTKYPADDTPYTLADLPTIETYLRIRSRHYKWQPDWEDFLQEGVIQAWKDITGDQVFTRAHARNRAAQRIKAVATSGHHPFTGHVKVDLSRQPADPRRGYSSAILDAEGRINKKAYGLLPLSYSNSAYGYDSSPEIDRATSVPSFEEHTVSTTAYDQMLDTVFGDDERLVKIMTMYIQDGFSQREIGDVVGVTQMQISRLVKKGLNMARTYYETEANTCH